MTVRKLSDSDKSDILNLYRQAGETTSTLAERYGVSNSTISRLLKSTLPENEYEALIASKRAARTYYPEATQPLLFSGPEPEVMVVKPLVEVKPIPEAESTPSHQLRLRPSLSSELETETPARVEAQLNPSDALKMTFDEDLESEPENLPQRLDPQPLNLTAQNSHPLDEDSGAQASAVAQILGEDLLDESEDLTDLDDEDDEDLEDLEDLDEDDLDEDTPIVKRRVPSEMLVQVLPLSEANLPKTCYLVIDRASELITRPLRDFSDLGQIPTQEVQQRTLPVFDNHRVARRFSTKRDRVIKVPDSRLLQKTCSQLQAKGITRLLVDGQVYSLSPMPL